MPIRSGLNEFQLTIPSLAIPGVTAGPSIIPGNNTYGTAVQLLSGAQVTDEAWGIAITFSAIAVSGAARDCSANVIINGVIAIADLLCGAASAFGGGLGAGILYYFPLRIAAGSTVAVALSVNNGTVGTGSAFVRLDCRPSRPDLIRAGSFVRTFGSTPASSTGTTVVPVSGSKSAFVQLGSAMTEPLWHWTLGVGLNNAVSNNNVTAWDLGVGDASNRRLIVSDQLVVPTASEAVSYGSRGAPAQCAPGDLPYARAASSGAPVTGWSAAAYGVGG